MARSEKISLAALLFLSAAIVAATVRLFALRFETGDTYPPYSTLRSDPLGSKALYEGLSELPRLEVTRNFRGFDHLPEGKAATLFFLGVDLRRGVSIPSAAFKEFEAFVIRGGRLVITYQPITERVPQIAGASHVADPRRGLRPQPTPDKDDEEEEKKMSEKKAGRGAKETEDKKKAGKSSPEENGRDDPFLANMESADWPSIMERWGVKLLFSDLKLGEDGFYEPDEAKLDPEFEGTLLPQTIPTRSFLFFTPVHDSWRRVYARGDKAVAIERKLGAGSIVMLADSYYFSNEAMRHERQPELLAWAAGPARQLLFDETHLGMNESPGVMSLIRKYRLGGALAALVALALLFIWRNGSSLVPRISDEDYLRKPSQTAARDAFAGLVNLLKRNVNHSALLPLCMAEWRRTLSAEREILKPKLGQIQEVVNEEMSKSRLKRDPAGAYRRIAQILATRRW